MIMINSIQEFIGENPDDKVSEVVQTLNHEDTGDRILILVEGDDDEVFYGDYLNSQKAYIYGMNGCEHFVHILNTLNPLYPGELAVIKDADFDHLNNTTYSHDNLFLTDKHDYEMMLVSPNRVKLIAMEYGIDAADAERIYDRIVANISDYSYIKWHNSRRGPGIPGINFRTSKAVHHYGKTIDESLNILRPYQHDAVNLNLADIESLKRSNIGVDKCQLVNGHDFCELIPKAIKDIKMRNIRNKDIPVKLRSHYSRADFLSTILANSLDAKFPGIVVR